MPNNNITVKGNPPVNKPSDEGRLVVPSYNKAIEQQNKSLAEMQNKQAAQAKDAATNANKVTEKKK